MYSPVTEEHIEEEKHHEAQTGALTMQNSDDFAMQGWLYPRVVEPLSAGDWVYVLAMRTVSLPTAPHSLTLARCLVLESALLP